MTSVAAPFGFRPAYHPSGLDRGTKRTIASGYAVALYKGVPVLMLTTGVIAQATVAADFKGIFAGVEYVDPSGKPTYSNFWPANQIATNIVAYVWEDPAIVYETQANGPVPQSAIGDQADVFNVANGNNLTGQSTCSLNATLAGAGAQGQFRIVGIPNYLDNTPGDLFTVVQVQVARDQFVANKVGI